MQLNCSCCKTPVSGQQLCPNCQEAQLPVGSTLRFRYRIEELLTRGSYSLIYKAIDLKEAGVVAVRELFPAGARRVGKDVLPTQDLDLSTLKTLREHDLEVHRMLREINHPNVLPVLDAFELHGTSYGVMPFLSGRTLQRRIEQAGPFHSKEARRVVLSLALAAEELHNHGYAHCDIKPENVFLKDDGTVILTDFGHAHVLERRPLSDLRLVSAGFTPIEQYAQEAVVEARADIYALGATLYCMLTGEFPPPATDLVSGKQELGRMNSAVEDSLQDAVRKAMAQRAAERPASMREFAAMLDAQQVPQIQPLRALKPMQIHHQAVTSICSNSLGDVLSASDDQTVKLWTVGALSRQLGPQQVFHDHHGAIHAATFLDSERWVTASEDGRLLMRTLKSDYVDSIDKEEFTHLTASLSYLAAVGTARHVRIWDTEGHPVRLADGPQLSHWATTLCYSETAETLFVGLKNGKLALLHGQSGQLIAERAAHEGEITQAVAVCGAVLTIGEDGRLRVWTGDGQLLDEAQISVKPLVAMVAAENSQIWVVDSRGRLFRVAPDTLAAVEHSTIRGEPRSMLTLGQQLYIGTSSGSLVFVPL